MTAIKTEAGPQVLNTGSSRRGSVLIIALWTLMFLGAVVVAVGSYVASALTIAERLKTGTVAHYLARAGVESSVMMVLSDTNSWDSLNEPWNADDKLFREVRLDNGFFSVQNSQASQIDNTVTNFGLVDTERLISINKAGLSVIQALLEKAGGLSPSAAASMASAIGDWRDKDDEVLTGGAESGYYRGLGRPYDSHDDEFESVHELLLVRGMDKELFAKLEPYITVYGTGRININTAGSVVLECLAWSCKGDPGSCAALAAKIKGFRDSGGYFDDPSPSKIVAALNASGSLTSREGVLFSSMMKYASLQSTCFAGTAVGRLATRERWDRRIDFVYDRSKNVIVYWSEL